MTLTAGKLTNKTNGQLISDEYLTIDIVNSFYNDGIIGSAENFILKAQSLVNGTNGQFVFQKDAKINIVNNITNQGEINTEG